jgi:amino acid adenylation domain-containing protein
MRHMATRKLASTIGERFRRPILPIEWWLLGAPKSIVKVINLCVEGVGRVDIDQLRAAVDRAGEACPGSRLARQGHAWVDSGVSPEVRLVNSGRLGHSVPMPELTRPLPGTGKAFCEVLLVDGVRPTVVFRASHAVMDGNSVKLWASEVFRALRNETPLGARSTTTSLDLGEPIGLPDDLAPALAVPRLFRQPAPAGPAGEVWRRWTIDGNHPALVAKLAAEIAKISQLPVTPIGIAVDARKFHPDIRSTANFWVKVILDVPAGQDWAATHAQLLTMMAERRGRVIPVPVQLLRAPLFLVRAMYQHLERRHDGFDSAVDISSLDHVDLPDFSTDDFEATAVYEVAPGGPTNADIAVVECNGHAQITLSWPAGDGGAGDKILDDLCEVLSPAAYRQYSSLAPAGGPAATGTTDRTVVQQFRDQVRATPAAIAVSGPEGDVSYAELERRALAVAERLRADGVGTESVVGVLADRSVLAVAGIWGVLLAGAAYLPMDTKYPDGRIRTLLDDARSAICLVQRPHHERDYLPPGCTQLVLDALPDTPESPDLPDVPAPGDLAYVIYTSGSTGTPKGVEIEHRSLSNYASWAIREYGTDSSTRLPLWCSLAFDMAEVSLILPLLAGGTLLLMPDEINHVAMQEVLDNGANMLTLTPSHLDLISRLNLRPTGVHTIFVSGEQLTRPVAMRAQEMFGPECRIINSYGPTETTVVVSHHVFDPERDTGAAVPIGVPQDNITLYLLDAERRFVAPGETGELYIGGVQLARGYRGRPNLTRERFLYMADGSRVYRTGDLARRLPSGEVECCGRIDDQIKIHGYRVEPAEIAQALESHPGVASAVVVARSRAGLKDKNLCAYVVTGPYVDIAELEVYLGERLPSYMVPAVTIKVDEIPRTVNGKVATAALPDAFVVTDERGAESRPRDGVEDAVAKIWARVLRVSDDQFGTANDFHTLGGDSVSLITMVAEVAREVVGPTGEKAFIRRLPEIIRCPTVERISELARHTRDMAGNCG